MEGKQQADDGGRVAEIKISFAWEGIRRRMCQREMRQGKYDSVVEHKLQENKV